MGIRTYLFALSDGNVEAVANNPNDLEEVLDRVVLPEQLESLNPLVRFLKRTFVKPKLTAVEGETLSIDKASDGIHFLLTGTEWEGDFPLNFLYCEVAYLKRDANETDQYLLFSSSQIVEIHNAIASIGAAELRKRFDPKAIKEAEIYPFMSSNVDEGVFDYLYHHFHNLKSYLSRVTASRLGVVISHG